MKEILEAHKLWVETNGDEGRRANLREADLSGADLSEADLSGANLREADLSGADLSEADLSGADLRGANLSWANLSGANLSGANLSWANLREADLSWADLREAGLPHADLREADLREADLPLNVSQPDEDLIKKVAEAALSGNLDMNRWHSECGTTHCIAGWAITLHPEGKELEEKSSSYLAGRLLLGDEAAEHFFDNNENAIEWLKTKLS